MSTSPVTQSIAAALDAAAERLGADPLSLKRLFAVRFLERSLTTGKRAGLEDGRVAVPTPFFLLGLDGGAP